MFWNIVIAVSLAVLVAVTTGLAGQLASTKRWHKWLFWGSGLLTILLIGIQIYRNEVAQSELEAKLIHIEQNTSQPPQVTVNPTIQVPPQQNEHTHLTFWDPASIRQPSPPTLPLREGANKVNIAFWNTGEFLAKNCHHAATLYPVEKATDKDKMFKDFVKRVPLENCPDLSPNKNPHSYQVLLQTYTIPLSAEQSEAINNGKEGQLCATARALWTDATGRYENQFCECWSGPYPDQSYWSPCDKHNSESKLN